MAESQNIEYKESWRDEYLKWVCGFANARGGKIYIGVRDDGEVVGVSDSKKLLEDIPNKIKAAITYEHDVRVETYPFPREGVREAIYNALGHNNYAASVPIQIRIEDDVMYISNNCILPHGWTVETLTGTHKSIPFNPSIANAFYRAGYIEAWGRGIQKVLESCKELGSPAPEYTVLGDDLTVKFTALASAVIPNGQFGGNNGGDGGNNGGDGGNNGGNNSGDVPSDLNETERIIYLQISQDGTLTAAQMSEKLGLAKRTIERTLSKLRENGVIMRIGSSRSGKWKIRK